MIKALIFLVITFAVFLIYYFSKQSEKGFFISFVLAFVIVFILTGAVLFLKNDRSEKIYISPKFDGEKVIPGYFDEKD